MNYTSDSRLEIVANETRSELLARGLSLKEIEANLRTWGTRITRWNVRAEIAGRFNSALSTDFCARIHALALATLGPESHYEYAVQGADSSIPGFRIAACWNCWRIPPNYAN